MNEFFQQLQVDLVASEQEFGDIPKSHLLVLDQAWEALYSVVDRGNPSEILSVQRYHTFRVFKFWQMRIQQYLQLLGQAGGSPDYFEHIEVGPPIEVDKNAYVAMALKPWHPDGGKKLTVNFNAGLGLSTNIEKDVYEGSVFQVDQGYRYRRGTYIEAKVKTDTLDFNGSKMEGHGYQAIIAQGNFDSITRRDLILQDQVDKHANLAKMQTIRFRANKLTG